MINVNGLKDLIAEKGYTLNEIAQMLGISKRTLSTKFKKGVLGSKEIESLIVILDITNPASLFFV